MGSGIEFKGSNHRFGPPKGLTEDEVKTLPVFVNGKCIVSCWELTAEELAEINRTGKVFLSVWSGSQLFPVFVGSETTAHGLVSQFGDVWRDMSWDGLECSCGGGWKIGHSTGCPEAEPMPSNSEKSARQLAKEASEVVFDYTDNNLSMFEACTEDDPVKAKELYELAKRLRDILAS